MKLYNVLHLQIQEAPLGIEAKIIDEPEWKEVMKFTRGEQFWKQVSSEEAGPNKWAEFHPNKMLYTLTYKNHTVFLDDLEVDPGHVVTGVRFANYKNNLMLLVKQTPFQFSSGSLYLYESKWIMNKRDKNKR